MSVNDDQGKQTADLRRRVEEITALTPESVDALSPDEARKLVHELRVHQIELEMQNEELQRVQVELDATRARYFDLYELAPVGYCLLSEEGLFLKANLTAANLLGTARGALIKQPITRFILGEDQDIYYRHRKELFSTGAPQDFELRMSGKDGKFIWAHLAATAAQDEDGAPMCRMVMSDISERKRAENAQQESEFLARAALNGLSSHIAIVNQDGRIETVNEAWRQFVNENGGHSGSVCEGADYLAVCDAATGHGSEEAMRFAEAIRDILTGGRSEFSLEYACHSPDEERWFMGRVTKFPGEGSARAVVAHENITERKQAQERLCESEAQFRELFDHMGDGVSIHEAVEEGRDFVFVAMNESGQKLSAICQEEVLGLRVTQVFPAAEKIGLLDVLRRVWRTGQPEHLPITEYADDRIRQWVENYVYKLPSGLIVAIYSDTSEKHRAEEALRKSQGALTRAQATAKIGSWEYDVAADKPMWSAEMYRIFDRDPALGEPSWEEHRSHVCAEDWERLDRAVQDALQQGQPYCVEFRVPLRYGGTIWAESRGEAHADATGEVRSLTGTVQDITGRKRAELALQEAVLRQAEAVRAGNVGLWDWDLTSDTVRFSREWKSQIGYEDEEIGDDLEEWRSRVHPDDLDLTVSQVEQSIAEVRQYHRTEFRFRHKDGSYRWILSQASVFPDRSGRAVRMLGTHIDITEHKLARERLEAQLRFLDAVMDSSPFAMWIADTTGVVRRVNRVLMKMLHLTEEQTLGKYNVLEDDNLRHAGLMPRVRAVFEEHQPLQATIPWSMSRAGDVGFQLDHDLWMHVSLFPIVDSDGNLMNVVCQWLDVSEEKNAAIAIERHSERLQALAMELERVEARERRRISEYLHDRVGQSLAAVRVKLAAWKRMQPSPERQALLASVEALIDGTIEETRTLTFDLSPPVLFELGLGPALEWLGEHCLEEEGIAFAFSDDGCTGDIGEVLASAVFRFSREILVNVVKHARARRVSVALSGITDAVCVTIVDDGIGMEREQYEQALAGRSGTYGLFSIEERLGHLGGKLEIWSCPGEGTRISITVPLPDRPLSEHGGV